MSLLQIKNVTMVKNGKTILKNIDLCFQKAKLTTIFGRSGSGKTSLLRLLNGLDSPTQGQVLFKGVNMETIPPPHLRQEIGMIFQIPVMFEGTVFENISFGPRLKNKNLQKEECLKLLEFVGLDSTFLNKDAFTLSVGEKQRVSIARTLANEPEVLLMDEPTSALDRKSSLAIEVLIKKLKKDGMTIILVTHNQEQALRLSDYLVLIEKGEVKTTGLPEHVLKLQKTGGCCR